MHTQNLTHTSAHNFTQKHIITHTNNLHNYAKVCACTHSNSHDHTQAHTKTMHIQTHIIMGTYTAAENRVPAVFYLH